MNIIEIEDFMAENQLSHVYIQSPRWNDEKIVSLSKTETEYSPYISVDSSTDEGVIGNAFDEIDFGNRMGRFLNSTEAAIYDDFEIVPHKEGLEKFKKYREIFEEKWAVNMELIKLCTDNSMGYTYYYNPKFDYLAFKCSNGNIAFNKIISSKVTPK